MSPLPSLSTSSFVISDFWGDADLAAWALPALPHRLCWRSEGQAGGPSLPPLGWYRHPLPSPPPLPWLWAQRQALPLRPSSPLKELPIDLDLILGLLEPAQPEEQAEGGQDMLSILGFLPSLGLGTSSQSTWASGGGPSPTESPESGLPQCPCHPHCSFPQSLHRRSPYLPPTLPAGLPTSQAAGPLGTVAE